MNTQTLQAKPAALKSTQVPSEAQPIIDALNSQAITVLGATLGTSTPVPFAVGTLGNFPYYWQNPTNLEFNAATYEWISSDLAAGGATPLQLGVSPFINDYIEALSIVTYSLSSADQASLNQAQQNATNQQAALLMQWKQAYGSIPAATATQQPIDIIMSTIANSWASPATNLTAIQQAPNLNKLLNNTPASGKLILPVLANYLNALGASISLQDATTMNNGYLAAALAAAQSPVASNGALTTDDGVLHPAYQVTTPLTTGIINGLKNKNSAANLSMTVSNSTSSEYQVSVNGSAGFSIPVLDFLEIDLTAQASYFSDTIATSSNTVTVEMQYEGITLVNFGPVSFDMSTGTNWFWMQPILSAIANGTNDVTGFKFSPASQTDFSTKGSFGYLSGVIISNYPTITITVQSASYNSIATAFSQSASLGISFLGIPISVGGSESTYSSTSSSNAKESTVTITLTPPPDMVAGTSEDSMGWIMGVLPTYPAAS